MASRYSRVIGIVGGLGPHAHIDFERRLLAAVAAPSRDQDYPDWLLSACSSTPDRTESLSGGGPSPVPGLVQSLTRLEGRADFAVIVCITAHAFLDQLRPRVQIPILDVVAATFARCRPGDRVGLLATTGTLDSGLFQRTARRVEAGPEVVSLRDLPAGRELQEELVMRPIYGPLQGDGSRLGGGLKVGGDRDPLTGVPHLATLTRAAALLAGAGAAAVIAGCTEISLVFGGCGGTVAGLPLLDCMDIAAGAALGIARGDLPLPPG